MLPDEVLLEIFEFYLDEAFCVNTGHTLRLRCMQTRPVSNMLDIWPALPIVISGNGSPTPGVDNITAALGRNDRACEINLWGDQLGYC